MKATVFEVESDDLCGFCYDHGGVRVHDSWFDSDGKTNRFLTQDRRHRTTDTQSYVYISKELGDCYPLDLITSGRSMIVATCKDEEGDDCYILCSAAKIGDVFEFDKNGFWPYVSNPKPNRYGRERDEVY